MQSGIYLITNIVNQKKYIGSSFRLEKRWIEHKRDLRMRKHTNPLLQRSWIKHGPESFSFSLIEECDKAMLLPREEYWINYLETYKREKGYNIHRFPKRTRLGLKASPETLLKMSISNGGKNHPNWGKKLSPSHVANIKKAITGVKKPNSGKKKAYRLLNPLGEAVEFRGLRKFCRENNLSLGGMSNVIKKRQNQHAGWRLLNI